MKHPDKVPVLVFADKDGNIKDFDELQMTGMSNGNFLLPALDELIPLPEGSELFTLPGRLPVGWETASSEPVLLNQNPFTQESSIQAVAAFIAPAHTSIYSSSFLAEDSAPQLPLFAYTAVGWYKNRFWVSAFRSDSDIRQDFNQYDQDSVNQKTTLILTQFPENRLIQHLGKCCLTYGCPAARNYFLGRWEAPLPTSPSCNAKCLGCISLQESGCCRATQDRISFVPSVEEIYQIGANHLETAENPIVSFGQGCEGEPLIQAMVIKDAIIKMRSITSKGTINLNTNGSLPDRVAMLAKAGLDSIRISLNSAQEDFYNRYFRPQNYEFNDVMMSITRMKEADRFVSINYFVLPGFSDSEKEFSALCNLIKQYRPDFIQLRNLNIDPDYYLRTLLVSKNEKVLGIPKWLSLLKSEFPMLRFGYFNPQTNNNRPNK